ncbi:GGDEF and EAL domain-containing protein [Blastomonas sp. AAP53]|uniref:putative bifunctional diguanylate cyclase/phosphodiesterase n=1 Tax=Blastomonas sp. AAP53 TaxID=1248760 RepID=UPI000476346A|nr:GGDEF and EAL domain-containing protein [Blastomonas sp. AAP53]
MSKTKHSPSAARDLPVMAILGLRDSADGDWDHFRAIQYTGLARYSNLRVVTNLVLGLMVCQLFSGFVPLWQLAGWMAMLGAALFFPTIVYRQSGMVNHDHVARRFVLQLVAATSLIAFVWCIPILVFAPLAGDLELATVWTILAALVVAGTLLLNALPLGAFMFNLVLMSASIVAYWQAGNMVTVGAITSFSILLALSGFENARGYLMFKLSEHGLAEKDEVVSLLLREFEEGDADWLWQIDSARRIINASPRFAFAVGREVSEIEGMPLTQLIAGKLWEGGNLPPSLHILSDKLTKRESFSNLVVKVHGADKTFWWELSASPRYDDNGTFTGFRGVGSDVTESRESAEKIARLARYDTLTGLPNRLQLTEALDRALKECEQWNCRCGFLMIDLDRFKSVNDTLGHLVGDRLLAQVSLRLRSLMGKDEMCGRLGGDEFAVVMRDTGDGQRIGDIAERIIDVLSQPYEVDQHTLFIGASIGSAHGLRDGRTVETLMRSADLALYRSKDEGGGRHNVYEPQLHSHAEERRVMEMALRKALEKDEFTLAFQPVVDAGSESLVAFEALLRWHNPEFGQVSPARFIPLAEDARLVVPIGNWVLHRACREAVTWPANMRVAVNVSAEQLYEPDFVDTVVEALSEAGLPPQRLELEVTESVFLREGSRAGETLDRILALGVGLSLDDFGTGYSALGYLSKTRFTTIKVDRSFVQGAARGAQESIAIIRAVVAMADSLGMSTTAEGAETEHEVQVVRKLGCKKIQGYYYGRPMMASDVGELFSDDRSAIYG